MRTILIQYEVPGALKNLKTCRLDISDEVAQAAFGQLEELAGSKISGVTLSLSRADMKDIWRDDVAKGKTEKGLIEYFADLNLKEQA